jgi:cyclic-di-AMP phosphodiesterase PgpH
MKSKKPTSALPRTQEKVKSRYTTLSMSNPLVLGFLMTLFLVALYYLTTVSHKGTHFPGVGEQANKNYLAKRPVSCKKPNPNLDPKRLKARRTAKAVYSWNQLDQNAVKIQLRSVFDQLGIDLRAAANLEREISLMRSRDNKITDKRPTVKVSEFYPGAQSDPIEPGAQVDDEAIRKKVEEMSKSLLSMKAKAWKTLVDTLSFSRLGLDDSECLKMLADPNIRDQVLLAVIEVLDRTQVWLVLDAFEPRFTSDRHNGIFLKKSGLLLPPEAPVYSYVEAIDQVHSSLADAVMAGRFGTLKSSQLLNNLVKNIVAGQLRPNFHRDDLATRRSMEAAESSVPLTVPAAFAKDEIIIPTGARVASWHTKCLGKAIWGVEQKKDEGITLLLVLEMLGGFLLVSAFILLPFYYIKKTAPFINPKKRDLALTALLLLLQSGLIYLYSVLAAPLQTAFPNLQEAAIYVAAPMALAPMIIRIMIGTQMALMVIIVNILLASTIFKGLGITDFEGNFGPFYIGYVAVTGLVGIMASKNVSRRLALAGAGVTVGIAGLIYWLLVYFSTVNMSTHGQLQLLVSSLLSGVLCYIFAIALIPSFEGIFGYLTDMKLMEYVNLNHPAMKELYEKARGTYDHSATVSKLAEVASRSIGANTLLAKAGSYFHDLGKLRAKEVTSTNKTDLQYRGIGSPQYFVENQTEGTNPHDHLTPAMSARILRRHVEKSQTEIRKYRLGKEIEDIAAQHHGTTVMQFFYNKAKELSTDSASVNEDDFRYPGPKPQTKEAGIIMLADSVEAAVRSLKEHSEGRIRHNVEHLINAKIEDKQLDECPLTFQELGKIREAFVEMLVSTYHGRISYPDVKRKDQSTVRIRKTHQSMKELRAEIDIEDHKTDEHRKSDLHRRRTTHPQARPDKSK